MAGTRSKQRSSSRCRRLYPFKSAQRDDLQQQHAMLVMGQPQRTLKTQGWGAAGHLAILGQPERHSRRSRMVNRKAPPSFPYQPLPLTSGSSQIAFGPVFLHCTRTARREGLLCHENRRLAAFLIITTLLPRVQDQQHSPSPVESPKVPAVAPA